MISLSRKKEYGCGFLLLTDTRPRNRVSMQTYSLLLLLSLELQFSNKKKDKTA